MPAVILKYAYELNLIVLWLKCHDYVGIRIGGYLFLCPIMFGKNSNDSIYSISGEMLGMLINLVFKGILPFFNLLLTWGIKLSGL